LQKDELPWMYYHHIFIFAKSDKPDAKAFLSRICQCTNEHRGEWSLGGVSPLPSQLGGPGRAPAANEFVGFYKATSRL